MRSVLEPGRSRKDLATPNFRWGAFLMGVSAGLFWGVIIGAWIG